MVYIKFTNKQNLKKHIEAVHEGIKPFKCSICDVKFANNYNPQIQEAQIQEWYTLQGCCKGQKSAGAGSNVACGGVPPPPGGAF